MKQNNWGLSLLRTYMCFLVILCHFWFPENPSGFSRILYHDRNYAVAVFMLLSFFLTHNTFAEHNRQKILHRFKRLLIPQIGWAVIYWCLYKIIDLICKTSLENSISDMFWQIFSGHSPKLNPTMWYQVDLIWITVLFLVILLLFKKIHTTVFLLLAAFAIYLQYSGIYLFLDRFRFEIKYPAGRLIEMIPIAVVGFLLSSGKIMQFFSEHRLRSITLSAFTIIMVTYFNIFSDIPGYGYQGIGIILCASAFVIAFYCLPLAHIPDVLKKILSFLTSHTLGIYCMHRMVGTLLLLFLPMLGINFPIKSLPGCILIYGISFMLSWFGTILLGKTPLRMLFE